MSIWILTLGSSDVQLKTKDNWTKLCRNVRGDLNGKSFDISLIDKNRFQAPARVIGTVYSQKEAEAFFDDLIFPLLNNFITKVINTPIEKIILVLSDQAFFTKAERDSQQAPYWKDTCTLQPLVEKYLKQELKESSADLKFQTLLLEPTSSNEGLDDWNAVLKMVQAQFSSLDFPENATIYVSHQAGTPAISSAVQFSSLSQFGNQVKFLVSNEHNPELTRVLPSSEYLKGIRKKEAEALLKSYNYSGIQTLLQDYLDGNETINILLKSAILWNVAKFDDFRRELTHYPALSSEVADRQREENWWWIAYEEVYLAEIRRRQGNIVEAFFHSFRAFEYIFAEWGFKEFSKYFDDSSKKDDSSTRIAYLPATILDDPDGPFSKITGKDAKKSVHNIRKQLENLKNNNKGDETENQCKDLKKENNSKQEKSCEGVELNLSNLCKLFKGLRYKDYKENCQELEIFWHHTDNKNVSKNRNIMFHQVQGMTEVELWSFWDIDLSDKENESIDKLWQNKLLKFLNFIVKKDFPEGVSSLEDSSLMKKVHEDLENAIANL